MKKQSGGDMNGAVQSFLALPVKEETRRAELERLGVGKREMSNRMSLAAALVGAATAGDVRAAKLVLDILGGGAPESGEEVRIVDDL